MQTDTISENASTDTGMAQYMQKVYSLLIAGLIITTAAAFGTELIYSKIQFYVLRNVELFYTILLVEAAIVWFIGRLVDKIPPVVYIFIFFFYGILNGFNISMIFLFFKIGLASKIFLSLSIMYAIVTAAGYVLKKDMSHGTGKLLMLGAGLIISAVINIITKSQIYEWIATCLAVILFVIITAWNIEHFRKQEKIKGNIEGIGSPVKGALLLYFDFIVIFTIVSSFIRRKL
jgi:FtsH-binding integral membrane protein